MISVKPLVPDVSSFSKKFITKIQRLELLAFDFDGVFTDNRVYVSQDGVESVTCWRSDGLGLSNLKKMGLPVWVISTEKNPVVSARCKKLGINCIQACDDKLTTISELSSTLGCSLEKTAFVGNDINDKSCLESVGLPMVVADAYPIVAELASYVTLNPGGYGAVREICDLIVAIRRGNND